MRMTQRYIKNFFFESGHGNGLNSGNAFDFAPERLTAAHSTESILICKFVLTSAWHQIQRTVKNACQISVQPISRSEAEESDRWKSIIASDWKQSAASEFQDFLQEFARLLSPQRTTVSLVARLFDSLWHGGSSELIRNSLEIISREFPRHKQATKLKEYAVVQKLWNNSTATEHRGEILRTVAEYAQAFDCLAPRLSCLSEELWANHPLEGQRTLSAVTNLQRSNASDAIVEGVAASISSDEFSRLALVETAAACSILSLRPRISGQPRRLASRSGTAYCFDANVTGCLHSNRRRKT